jgi:fatty-acyl-CoA synthase
MFHCNGWCFPWSISVVAGTHVCLRAVRAPAMYDAIASHKVTHLCGAPIVMATLAQCAREREEASAARRRILHRRGAAAGSRAGGDERGGLQRHASLRLTECYGPAVVNDWHGEWNALGPPSRR